MYKFICVIFLLLITCSKGYCYTLDVSVDEDIKKNYTKNEVQTKQQSSSFSQLTKPKESLIYDNNQSIEVKTQTINKTGIKIPSGTKFCLKSNEKITEYLNIGHTLTFVSCAPLVRKNITIPLGTKFTGIVSEKHSPQATGNGAMIGIKINGMNYNGSSYPLNGKITKVNSDMVFFNNIKGERQYIQGVKKQVNNGRKFQQKTRQVSLDWKKKPVMKIVSGVPKAVGAVGKALAIVSSPFYAIGVKGGHINIAPGTIFEVKLLDNVYISK